MGMPVIQPCNITRQAAVGNIISSIAMEQKSLAHVLNAESEKLDAIISNPDVTPQELICANNSVKRAVDSVIQLELGLKSKLELFSCTICQQV